MTTRVSGVISSAVRARTASRSLGTVKQRRTCSKVGMSSRPETAPRNRVRVRACRGAAKWDLGAGRFRLHRAVPAQLPPTGSQGCRVAAASILGSATRASPLQPIHHFPLASRFRERCCPKLDQIREECRRPRVMGLVQGSLRRRESRTPRVKECIGSVCPCRERRSWRGDAGQCRAARRWGVGDDAHVPFQHRAQPVSAAPPVRHPIQYLNESRQAVGPAQHRHRHVCFEHVLAAREGHRRRRMACECDPGS